MTELEHSILFEVQEQKEFLEQLHLDPTPLLSSLERWQQQLQISGSRYHLVWCFTPALCLWYGPTSKVSLRSTLAKRKLQNTPLWSLDEELFVLGDSPADTLVLMGEQGESIYVRPQRYLEKLREEKRQRNQSFLQVLQAFSSEEELLSWRQELNLLHEWGHIATDRNVLYKEPLLDKLERFEPPDAFYVMNWIRTLLEMLADVFPGEGALFLLPELGSRKEQSRLPQMLLLDRLLEYQSNHLEADFEAFCEWAMPVATDPHPDWELFHLCCGRFGEILQDELLHSIEAIPENKRELKAWKTKRQQVFRQECLAIF